MLSKNRSNFHSKPISVYLLISLLFLLAQLWPQEKPALTEIKAIVEKLASEEFEGREAGTKGNQVATDYLVNKLKELGAKPFGKNYIQSFHLTKLTKAKPTTSITILTGEATKTFNKKPIAIGHFKTPQALDLPIVFAGYGITSKKHNYDDYNNLVVKNKAVLIFRYDPSESKDTKYKPWPEAFLQEKFDAAKKNGAKAIILVNGPNSNQAKTAPFIDSSNKQQIEELSEDIPFIQVDTSFLDLIAPKEFDNWSELQKALDHTEKSIVFDLGETIWLNLDFHNSIIQTENIIAHLEGQDPQLKDEYIVIGAHYDHVGLGYFGSKLGNKGRSHLHPGADDNASGVAAILNIIKSTQAEKQNKRSLLFIFFAAEEKGLFGSEFFVKKPDIPLNQIKAMINLDMVGYYREGIKLRISGAYSSSLFLPFLEANKENLILDLTKIDPKKGPSDHANFTKAQIPSMHFFTNLHDFYHSPSDTPEKLNYEGLLQISLFIKKIARELANAEKTIEWDKNFIPLESANPGIHIINNKNGGVQIRYIDPNSSGTKAGLLVNDIITKLGPFTIQSYIDYASIIRDQTVGTQLEITIKRKIEEKWQEIQLTLQL